MRPTLSEVLFNSGGSDFYLYNENSDRTTGVNILQVADQVMFSVASSSLTWVLVVKQYVLPTGMLKWILWTIIIIRMSTHMLR